MFNGDFMEIILASASKRRIEFMNELGYDFKVIPSNSFEFVENYRSNEDLVMQLAKIKGESVFNQHPEALVLGFDTLVFLNDEVLGKPQNEEECIKMISELSNKEHIVITGAYLRSKDYVDSFASSCKVKFCEIPLEDIKEYAKTEEPYDKSGGYAIQGFIGRFIEWVDGDIFSVIGFPKALVYKKVREYIKNH